MRGVFGGEKRRSRTYDLQAFQLFWLSTEFYLRLFESTWGDLQVAGVEPKHVVKLRDSCAATPADASNLLWTLSAIFGWSAWRGWRADNPCRVVPNTKTGEGWAPWSWDAIDHFRQHVRRYLWEAAALALYTGQRLSDVPVMKWSDILGHRQ